MEIKIQGVLDSANIKSIARKNYFANRTHFTNVGSVVFSWSVFTKMSCVWKLGTFVICIPSLIHPTKITGHNSDSGRTVFHSAFRRVGGSHFLDRSTGSVVPQSIQGGKREKGKAELWDDRTPRRAAAEYWMGIGRHPSWWTSYRTVKIRPRVYHTWCSTLWLIHQPS